MSQKDDLLVAAIACLNERGYAKTTSRDIAAAAGISSLASIVYHYGSKESLLNSAIAEIVRQWIDRLGQLMSNAASGTDGLLLAVDEYYETLESSRGTVVGLVDALAQAQHSGEVRDQLADHYQQFRLMLGEVLAHPGGHAPEKFEGLASLLMALVDGLLLQWLLDPSSAVPVEALRRGAAALMSAFLVD